MVRRFLLFLMGIGPSMFAEGQHWAVKCGGVGNERVVDVKTDLADGVLSIGEFGPGGTVLGQPLTCQGLSDVFVAKQSATGALQWVVQAGGAGLDFASKVCAAPDGSVIVCGQFTGTADLFGTSATAQGGSTDLFVAKLSGTNGSLIWVRTGGSATYTDRAANVAVGADGRVASRPVRVERTEGESAIVTDGINPGEQVVTEGQNRLRPGARAQVRTAGAQGERSENGARRGGRARDGGAPRSREAAP